LKKVLRFCAASESFAVIIEDDFRFLSQLGRF